MPERAGARTASRPGLLIRAQHVLDVDTPYRDSVCVHRGKREQPCAAADSIAVTVQSTSKHCTGSKLIAPELMLRASKCKAWIMDRHTTPTRNSSAVSPSVIINCQYLNG